MKKIYMIIPLLLLATSVFANSTGVSGIDSGLDTLLNLLQGKFATVVTIIAIIGATMYIAINHKNAQVITTVITIGGAVIVIANAGNIVSLFGLSGASIGLIF